MNDAKKYMTQKEAESALGLSGRGVRHLIEKGRLTQRHVGKRAIYDAAEVMRLAVRPIERDRKKREP